MVNVAAMSSTAAAYCENVSMRSYSSKSIGASGVASARASMSAATVGANT